MAIRQQNAILDAAEAWKQETGSLYGLASAVDTAADAYRNLIDMRRGALRASAFAAAFDPETGALVNQGALAGYRAIASQLEMVESFAASAGQRARQPYGTVRTPRGNALLVSDPANQEIRAEIIRLKEDVAGHVYFTGTYRQTPIVINMGGMGGITENIYANQLSDAERDKIAYRSGQYASGMVAESLEQAIKYDLRNGGGRYI
jgi:hypothetical protein